jgi:16S rRNA (guanine527-N7)-methyltransferase
VPPELDRTRLEAGATQLGLALTDAQITALLEFASLLLRWNRVHNLTAIRSADELLTHHLLDALSLVRPLQDQLGDAAEGAVEVLDVGSGGGLPGIPLAIACPHWRITLVDAVQKKAAFLTQAALELKLGNVTVHHARVEQFRGSYRVITSRAFAALADFVGWTRHLLATDGFWLAMKARLDPGERQALPADLVCSAVLPIDVPGLGEQRHLIRIEPRCMPT